MDIYGISYFTQAHVNVGKGQDMWKNATHYWIVSYWQQGGTVAFLLQGSQCIPVTDSDFLLCNKWNKVQSRWFQIETLSMNWIAD